MVNLTAAIERLTGRPHRLDGPYLICADPGGDPYIATWDESVLGPRPTEEAMAAAGLEVARDAAVARLQAEKWRRMLGTFRDTKGHLYHVDNDSRALLTGKVAVLGATGKPLPAGFRWKTAEADAAGEPVYVVHDAETLLALSGEIDAWTNAVFSASEAAQAAVRAATDEAGIAAAEAAVAWPANG